MIDWMGRYFSVWEHAAFAHRNLPMIRWLTNQNETNQVPACEHMSYAPQNPLSEISVEDMQIASQSWQPIQPIQPLALVLSGDLAAPQKAAGNSVDDTQSDYSDSYGFNGWTFD